jgi:uncharacterized protein YutE (UPF0331/DUF86 family)
MDRLDKYKRKINFIVEKIHNLPENPLKNEFFLDALFYRIQNAADASMDIIAMLCKDLGIMVKDDYSNIESLESINLFNSKMRDDLARLNGLRNALVHKYNKIDTDLVISKKEEIIKILEEFIDKVEKIIDEKFKNSG